MAITSKKYLDFKGLEYFWGKAKTYIDIKSDAASGSINDLTDRVEEVENGLNAITDGAPEAFNTLKEVAEWIDAHGDNQAAEIIGDLNKIKAAFPLESDLTYEGAYTGKTTVKADVQAAKDAIDELSETVGSIQNDKTDANNITKIATEVGLGDNYEYTGVYETTNSVAADVAAAKSAIESLASDVDQNIGRIPEFGEGDTIDSIFA